jgi:predicted dehydrogenase
LKNQKFTKENIMQTRSRIRWLILGTNYISDIMLNAINVSETGTVVAVAAQNAEKTRQFAENHAIPNFGTNVEELIAADYVDAVYIGLPNNLHGKFTIMAAQAGKHVLCEKSFVTSVSEAEAVIAEVKKANVVCMEALMYRCHPLTKKLVELIDSNAIGQIKAFHATYIAEIPPNKVEGGALRNLGCYPISLIRMLAKAEPLTVAAIGTLCQEAKPSDSYANVIMNFDNDRHGYITVADKGKKEWSFTIKGSEGSIKLLTNPWMPEQGDNCLEITSRHSSVPVEKITLQAAKPLYTYQIDAIGNAIAGDPSQLISLEDSLENVRVIEACRSMVMQQQRSQIRLDVSSSIPKAKAGLFASPVMS